MKNAWKSVGWGGALILLLTVVAYIPALRGGFIWDDDHYVTHNPTLRSAEGLRRIWLSPDATVQYYPLTFTVFWLEYHQWGLDPVGFHLVNVLFQAANAILFWRLLSRLSVPGAWWAAAVFALHPVHVMSVAWVTELKNVLSGLFFLTAVLSYLRFSGLDDDRTVPQSGHRRFYGLAGVVFVRVVEQDGDKRFAGGDPADSVVEEGADGTKGMAAPIPLFRHGHWIRRVHAVA